MNLFAQKGFYDSLRRRFDGAQFLKVAKHPFGQLID